MVRCMAEPTFDTEAAHRWFAAATNNAVWDWLDAHEQGAASDPIIHAAHASYFHWNNVGSAIQKARAASLVANVHATLGNAEIAAGLANECQALLDAAGDEAADWDLAFGLDSMARAAAAGGDDDAAAHKARARAAGDAIADDQDKAVFDDWFSRGNWHGVD